MQDPVELETKDLRAWRMRVSDGRAKEFRDRIVETASRAKGEVLVLRGDLVFGYDHLRSALYHAKRAIRDGRNSSESLAMETLLYASGERQLSTAINKMSVDAGSDEVVVAQLTGWKIIADPSWTPMEGEKVAWKPDDLARFGISREELATVGLEKAVDLVLEKVASVDVLKK